MKNPRTTWVAIVKKLKLEWEQRIEIRNGNYQVFPRFNIKNIGFKPYEDIVVDFYELKGKDASYVGMAKKYPNINFSTNIEETTKRLNTLKEYQTITKCSILLITHNPKLLDILKPDYIHILKDKKIIKTGDASLAAEIEKTGFKEISN